MVGYIVSGFLACFIKHRIIGEERIHKRLEIFSPLYLETTFASFQALGFKELLIIRTKQYWDAVYRGL